jgi:dihydrofolate synthase/folylpolyglutamate synthase
MRLWVPLIGRHQLVNATVAVAALDVVRARGFEIPGDVLRSGLAATRWPGRLEILSRQPLLVVDGAHNEESAQRLVEALGEWFGQRRRLVVFGASFDKDIGGMLDVLVPGSECVIIAESRHPRRSDLRDLAARVEARGGRAIIAGSVAGAVEQALDLAGPDDLICVTGSLFVVAEAREGWLERGSGSKLECDPPPVH